MSEVTLGLYYDVDPGFVIDELRELPPTLRYLFIILVIVILMLFVFTLIVL